MEILQRYVQQNESQLIPDFKAEKSEFILQEAFGKSVVRLAKLVRQLENLSWRCVQSLRLDLYYTLFQNLITYDANVFNYNSQEFLQQIAKFDILIRESLDAKTQQFLYSDLVYIIFRTVKANFYNDKVFSK